MPMAYKEFQADLDLTLGGHTDSFDIRGYGVGAFAATVVLGAWSGSVVTWEGTVDQQTWVAFDPSITFSADGVEVVGDQDLLFSHVRARVSTPNAGGGTCRVSGYVREA